jgi:hypothetical protein
MNRRLALVLVAALAIWQAPAQARVFSQAELDALLAPVALYPDTVLSHILVAATQPDDLREAAAWLRSNPQLSGENAVRAADAMAWHPSVKALAAFPDLVLRMDESPQWTADLGAAFLEQEPYVMDTVQGLRSRAQASGTLQSNDHYSVQQQGSSIAVYPVHPHVVYVPYYNPHVVYGPWWHAYRPVYWRPWHPRPAVFVSTHFFATSVDWHRRHVVRHVVHHHRHQHHHHRPHQHRPVTIHNHAHPVRPIVGNPVTIQSHPQPVRPIVDTARIHQHRKVQAPPPGFVHHQTRAVGEAVRQQQREGRSANRSAQRRG